MIFLSRRPGVTTNGRCGMMWYGVGLSDQSAVAIHAGRAVEDSCGGATYVGSSTNWTPERSTKSEAGENLVICRESSREERRVDERGAWRRDGTGLIIPPPSDRHSYFGIVIGIALFFFLA